MWPAASGKFSEAVEHYSRAERIYTGLQSAQGLIDLRRTGLHASQPVYDARRNGTNDSGGSSSQYRGDPDSRRSFRDCYDRTGRTS